MPRPEKMLFGAPWFGIMGIVLFPLVWHATAWVERTFFPVWRNVTTEVYEVTEDGLEVYVQFDKVFECELIDVLWYNGPVRVGVDRDPDLFASVRTEGTHRVGPWTLHGITSLEGTTADVIHDCHPGWPTISQIYP